MRLAVLGCGSIGRRHLRNLRDLGYDDIVAYDPVADVRNEVAQQYGVAVCATLDNVWHRQPCVTLVTAPTHYHVALATQAALHGCHLFIEKPLSHTMDGVMALQDIVERQGLVTMIGCNMRFHPGPVQVKAWIEADAIGSVLAARLRSGSYLPRWRPEQDYRQSYSASPEWGGVILDCIHEIDLALWLLGDAEIWTVAARPACSLGLRTDGLAEIILDHGSGAISSLHLNFIQRNYRRSIEVIGDEGTIDWEWEDTCVTCYGADGLVAERATLPPDWSIDAMYRDELAHLLDHITNGVQTANPLSAAAHTLELALAARSA